MEDGVPDLIVLPNIAIEMKKNLSHRNECVCVSVDQIKWGNIFKQKGWHYILAHGSDDAIKQLNNIVQL